jgi:hypothetical protein
VHSACCNLLPDARMHRACAAGAADGDAKPTRRSDSIRWRLTGTTVDELRQELHEQLLNQSLSASHLHSIMAADGLLNVRRPRLTHPHECTLRPVQLFSR